MSADRYFLDTAFIISRIDRRDAFHARAMMFRERVHKAREVWTTEAVLIEIGNALAAGHRADAIRFFEAIPRTPNFRIVPVTSLLLSAAVNLYSSRRDKDWGLTDCISFEVMRENGLNEALTADRHFIQAGFRALLLEEES
jgi:predicted nucleic acid-binding protein